MTAGLKAASPRRVIIALPPVYTPRVGEKIQFKTYCFGCDRNAVGTVLSLENSICNVAYEVQLPPEGEVREIYPHPFKYPKKGLFKAESWISQEEIKPYDGDQLELDTAPKKPVRPKKPTKKPTKKAQKAAERAALREFEQRQAEELQEAIRLDELRTQEVIERVKAEALHDALALLEREQAAIRAEGELGIRGAYIACNEVCKRPGWFQAMWRCERKVFESAKGGKTKSRYIGKQGSLAHHRASAMWSRRQRFDAICKQIDILSERI